MKEDRISHVSSTVSNDEEQEGNSGILSSVLNVMNSTMGVGILTLPYVMANFGLILGLIILVVIQLLSIFTVKLLLESKSFCTKSSFPELGIYCFKKPGEILIHIIIAFDLLGGCLGFVVIFGTTVDQILKEIVTNPDPSFVEKFQFYTIFMGLVILPFAFAKSTDKLKFASYLSVCAIALYTFITLYNFGKVTHQGKLPKSHISVFVNTKTFKFDEAMGCFPTCYQFFNIFKSLFLLVFLAFNFHFNVFPIYHSLKNRSHGAMMKVTYFGQTSVLLIYCTLATFGYLPFGNLVDGNFLKSFEYNEIGAVLYYMINVAYMILSIFAYPLQFFEGRNSTLILLLYLYQAITGKKQGVVNRVSEINNKDENIEQQNFIDEELLSKNVQTIGIEQLSYTYWIAGSLILHAAIVFLGIVLNSYLVTIFSFVGAIGANAIAYILPASFYLYVNKAKNKLYNYCWAVLAFGFASMIISVVGTILTL